MLYILPIGRILLMQAVHDVYDTAIRIDGGRALLIEVFIGERPTTDAEDCIGIKELARIIKPSNFIPLGWKGRMISGFHRISVGATGVSVCEDSGISHVPLACSC